MQTRSRVAVSAFPLCVALECYGQFIVHPTACDGNCWRPHTPAAVSSDSALLMERGIAARANRLECWWTVPQCQTDSSFCDREDTYALDSHCCSCGLMSQTAKSMHAQRIGYAQHSTIIQHARVIADGHHRTASCDNISYSPGRASRRAHPLRQPAVDADVLSLLASVAVGQPARSSPSWQ